MIKLWPSIALFALLMSPVGAQETPGNGTILNPLANKIEVIVKPNGPGATEKQFHLAPGTRLDLQKYTSYDIFVPSERHVYPIEVPRLSSSDSKKHFYAFDFENDKLVIRSGLPDVVFQNASSNAEAKASSMLDQWTFRGNDRNSGVALSPKLQRRLQWEWYAGSIYQQTGVVFVVLDSWDGAVLVFKDCEDDESLLSLGNRVASGLNLDAQANPAKSVRFCCQGKSGVSLETINEIVKSRPRNANKLPSVTQTAVKGTFDLGEFSGIDDTNSELDLLVQEVRRLNFFLSDSRFEFVSAWKPLVLQCLGLQACLLDDQPHLSQDDLRDLSMMLRQRLADLYACAFLQSNRSKNLVWQVDGPAFAEITLQCSFSEDGRPEEYRSMTGDRTYTVRADIYNVKIQFDGIDALHVRGAGWCMVEKITGTTIPGHWEYVPQGENTIRWEKADYCVRVKVNQSDKQLDSVFRPIPTQANDRKWLFNPSGWQAGN